MEKINFEFLNSIRGLAAASVLCSHSITDVYFFHGYAFGVIEFFLLSSFLLTFHYLKRMETLNGTLCQHLHQLVNYIVIRFFRIYVPFAVFCILVTASTRYDLFLNNKDHQIPLKNFLLLNFDSMPYNTYLWTIPTEIKYYFLIPVFSFIAHRLKLSYKWNCLVHLTLLIFEFSMFFLKKYFTFNFHYFFIGSSLAVLYKSFLDAEIIDKIKNYKKTCRLICVISFIIFICGIRIQVVLRADSHLLCIYWSTHMLLMLIGAPNAFTEFLVKIKLLKWIGKYSYGFYLFHGFSINLFSIGYDQFAWFRRLENNYGIYFKILVLYSQTLFFGFVYYELVENTCLKVAKKINNFLGKYFE